AILEKNPHITPTDVLKPKGEGWCPRLDSNVVSYDQKAVQETRNQSLLGRWSRTAPLMELLRAGRVSGYGGVVRFGFGPANLEKLLRVSPPQARPSTTSGASSSPDSTQA